MKSKAKTSSKILTAVLIVLSVALSAVLVAGAFMHIMNNESGVPGFAPDSDKTIDESNPVNTDEADIQENAGETVPNDESVILSPVSPSAQAVYSEEPTVEFHEKKVSFICAGDNLIHTDVYGSAERFASGTDAEYDFKPMYSDIKEFISSYDFAFLNQEVPIAGKDRGFSGYPCFNSPDELGDAVVDTGFNLINIATNHMLDKRNSGLISSINYWREKPVAVIGDYLSEEEFNEIEILEKDGIKIAILAYTYGTNGIPLQNNGDGLVVPYIDEEDIKEKVARAKDISDLVFVSIHWGDENQPFANATQKRLARMMADIGVDVIIGHHSHSIHPTEWLDRPDGGKTLVTYSLGNLLSGMQSPINVIGGMLSFDVVFYDDGLMPEITNVKIIPTVCHFYGVPRDYHVYLFTDYTRALAEKHRLAGQLTYDKMKKIVTDTVDEQFLTEEFLAADGR